MALINFIINIHILKYENLYCSFYNLLQLLIQNNFKECGEMMLRNLFDKYIDSNMFVFPFKI